MVAPRLFELLLVEPPDWLEVLAESSSIEDAKYIQTETNLTPLHLAVMAKDPKNNELRIGAIRSLLQSDLTSTEVACVELDFTPLMHVFSIQDLNTLEYDVPVVKLLMDHNPQAFAMRNRNNHTALDIHIISMSRLQQRAWNVLDDSCQKTHQSARNNKKDNVTCLLNVILEYDCGINLWKSLELLVACNTAPIMDYVAKEDAVALRQHLEDRRQQREHPGEISTVRSRPCSFQGFWVWEFLLSILKSQHQHTYQRVKPVPPFNALHTASQIDDFPLALLILCMRAYAIQIRTPSFKAGGGGCLPIHFVASWKVRRGSSSASCSSSSSKSSKSARKSMVLTQLLSAYPLSCHIPNDHGKTPWSLAIETGTVSWNGRILKRLAPSVLTQNEQGESASVCGRS